MQGYAYPKACGNFQRHAEAISIADRLDSAGNGHRLPVHGQRLASLSIRRREESELIHTFASSYGSILEVAMLEEVVQSFPASLTTEILHGGS